MPYNFVPFGDAARRARYATPLIHQIDAIASFDASTQAVSTTIDVLPSKVLIPFQGVTVTLNGTAADHSITAGLIVHGRDDRGLDVAIPMLFSAVTAGVTTSVVRVLGWAFSEIDRLVFVTKGTGPNAPQAGDKLNIGYDLSVSGGPVIVLADEVYDSLSVATAPVKRTTGLASENRHKRWTTGAPTSTANRLVLATQPPIANIV